MAKYRHRIFEMYEIRDEALRAMTARTTHAATEATSQESWTFKHLAVSHSAGVTHVEFKGTQTFGADTLSDLREDLAQLADKLVRNSAVLFNFTGVKSFCADSIQALVLFNQKLRIKGSRIALCCLDASARESFFDAPPP